MIVDDNSDDGSWDLAKKFAAEDPRFKPMKTDLDPGGHSIDCNRYAHNINLALPKCQGDYISYLCDDDIFKSNRLEVMVDFLDNRPDVMVCYGNQELQWLDDEGKVTKTGFRAGPKVCWEAAQVIDHSSVMHRKEVYGILGGWNEDKATWRMGDAGYWVKINERWAFYRIDQVLDIHRFNDLSVSFELDKRDGSSQVSSKG